MLTNEVALEVARKELDSAMYVIETSTNPGLRKIAENKVSWLSALIRMAESYCNFHWIPCSLALPEETPESAGKQVIPCIVAVRSKYPNGRPNIEKRVRQQKRNGEWEWSKSKKDRITHWAAMPIAPKAD